MANTSTVLVTNVVVSAPTISPSVSLTGAEQYWDTTAQLFMPVGTSIDVQIESSTSKNGTYFIVDMVHIEINSPTGKNGTDATHPVYTSSIDRTKSPGPWFRMNVTAVTGTVTVISLTVNNHA